MTRPEEAKLLGGLSFLLEAFEYSKAAERHPWDFALEIEQLRELGLNYNDLRWLSTKEYVEHRVETTRVGEDERTFQRASKLIFEKRSCFVLTENGVLAARNRLGERESLRDTYSIERVLSSNGKGRIACAQSLAKDHPVWDGNRRELWICGQLVKRFRRPAANQETILAAFEEEQWPSCISDPIPQDPEIDAKRRLNDAIKSLNRHQTVQMVRFKGDGTAEGIIWERVAVTNGHSRIDADAWHSPRQLIHA